MNKSVPPGLVILEAGRLPIRDAATLDSLVETIAAGQVVLLKSAVETHQALALRDSIVRWRNQEPIVSFSVNTNQPGINFHRIDADPEKSQLPHRFHQHGFGALQELDDVLAQSLLAIAQPMLALQNRLASSDLSFDLPEVRIKALQYPSGGGFLMRHTHPLEPQRVGLILAISRMGEDFSHGGTTFDTPLGIVDCSAWHDAGDLILFRYDLEHAVGPIDGNSNLDWASVGGRWTLVLELLSTHSRSEAA